MDSRATAPAIPLDASLWRPQVPRAMRTPPTIRDPLVEPLWSGTRVLAHFVTDREGGASRLELLDEHGTRVDDQPDVLRELAGAILAFDAVLDGILTPQATRGGEGSAILHRPEVSRGSVFLPRDAGIDVAGPTSKLSDVVAFVALDLLRIDGQALFDVPLLERKRLLESTIQPGERVRVSVYTRPPVDPWVASWKSTGFKGAMLKAANSRYRPGGYSEEWTEVTRLQQRR